jgi:hypothetical protein
LNSFYFYCEILHHTTLLISPLAIS